MCFSYTSQHNYHFRSLLVPSYDYGFDKVMCGGIPVNSVAPSVGIASSPGKGWAGGKCGNVSTTSTADNKSIPTINLYQIKNRHTVCWTSPKNIKCPILVNPLVLQPQGSSTLRGQTFPYFEVTVIASSIAGCSVCFVGMAVLVLECWIGPQGCNPLHTCFRLSPIDINGPSFE